MDHRMFAQAVILLTLFGGEHCKCCGNLRRICDACTMVFFACHVLFLPGLQIRFLPISIQQSQCFQYTMS